MRSWLGILACCLLAGCTVEGCRDEKEIGERPDARVRDAAIGGDAVIEEACNVRLQTSGCSAAEPRCTWAYDIDTGGESMCVPQGTIALGDACGLPGEWPLGYDDCLAGAICVDGICRQICDQNGGVPRCDALHGCVTKAGLLEEHGATIAGYCEVGCDPLTQEALTGPNPTACGSTSPSGPDHGCYGTGEFACSPTPAGVARTDRVAPLGDLNGDPYFNGCSPGFLPFFNGSTGTTKILCAGFCAALETDNTPAHVNNGKGDPNALAKLPNEIAPAVGNATCEPGKKGSEESSRCLFLWPYLVGPNDTLPLHFASSALLDTLGVCMAIEHFKYDANGDGAAETPVPDCATLPQYGPGTSGNFDDASDFACQTYDHSPHIAFVTARATADLRLRSEAPLVLARHPLD